MTIHLTPNFQLAYIDVDTPLEDLAEASRQAAETIDAALARGGVAPPGAQDLVAEATTRRLADEALDARLDALELKPATGGTLLTLEPNWTHYNDGVVPWTGLRWWRQGNVVTISGAWSTSVARANLALIGSLPFGVRPPATVQSGALLCASSGQVKLSGALAAAGTTSGSLTFALAT